MTIPEVATLYGCRVNESDVMKSHGLSQEQVTAYLNKYGANTLSPPPKPNYFIRFLSYLFSPFNLVLLICGIVSLVIWAFDISNTTNVTRAL